MDWSELKKHYIGLDVFRAVAVLAICAFHTSIHLGCNYGPLQGIVQMGAVFMTAFFMLSGYSLFVNHAGEDLTKLSNARTFYIKRAISILPIYWIAALIYIPIFGHETALQNVLLVPAETLGIQSVFASLFDFTHNGGTWFISCILICYVFYPFIQEAMKQLSKRAKILFLVVASLILLYSPLVVWEFKLQSIYSNPFFRLLEFGIGVALASLKPEFDRSEFVKKHIYNFRCAVIVDVLMIAAVTLAVHLDIGVGNYMLYSWICLPCFIVMLISMSGVRSAGLSKSRFLKYLGGLSYTFFLAQLYSNFICKKIIMDFSISSNLAKIGGVGQYA